jgi:hypothetical protein
MGKPFEKVALSLSSDFQTHTACFDLQTAGTVERLEHTTALIEVHPHAKSLIVLVIASLQLLQVSDFADLHCSQTHIPLRFPHQPIPHVLLLSSSMYLLQ